MHRSEIDLESGQSSYGQIHFPLSDDLSASRRISIPVFFSGKKPDPFRTMLVLAGTHGDEYEGQILARLLPDAIAKLNHRCEFIVFPSLNLPACDAATRLSPIDGKNMFRSYDGSGNSITARITSFLRNEIFPRADVVLDLHSGGPTLRFLPSVIVHTSDGSPMHEATMKFVANLAPALQTIRRPRESPSINTLYGLLQNERKVLLTTELGGGSIEKEHIDKGISALSSLLETLIDENELPESPAARKPSVCLDLGSEGEVYSPMDGIFQSLFEPGDIVSVAQK